MHITTRAKVVAAAVSIATAAGISGLAGSAFTGTGVTNSAPATRFIGGTVSQTVTGATLSSIDYTFTDGTDTAISGVTLTFADGNTNGKTPTIVFSATTPESFTCGAIDSTSHISSCSAVGTAQTGATGISVTVN